MHTPLYNKEGLIENTGSLIIVRIQYLCVHLGTNSNLTKRLTNILEMTSMPPPPPPPTLRAPIGSPPPFDEDSETDSDPESDEESESDTATLSASSPTAAHHNPTDSQEQLSDRLLDQLRSAVEGYPSFANYCCGGSIPISTAPRNSPSLQDSSKAPITSPPVILRFDTHSGNVCKLNLPPEPEDDKGKGKKKVDVEDLLVACTPELTEDEKSGRGIRGKGKKSSAKMDREKFSVNIHPADIGIVDTIKQILLPEVKLSSGDEGPPEKGKSIWEGSGKESWREREEHWGVRAELSELSVYFSSSSNAQKQFDTPPRRGSHFGTLIICLPSPHQGAYLPTPSHLCIPYTNRPFKNPGGGQLLTHHNLSPTSTSSTPKNHETFFPTASLNPTLTWAAYRRTSSHAILPITCGHLVTLTYNLYITEATGSILQRFPIADPRLYPLYRIVRGFLGQREFMSNEQYGDSVLGGTLAFHTTHPYSHTRRQTSSLMPYSLLGIDAIIFCVFRALGLKTMVAPVLGDEAWDDFEQVKEERELRGLYGGEGEAGGGE
ncbi:hypothetical protein G7Y89_g3611 [Cudoniella acicularis]|uniref:Uncharacterized protein n=1 Tax=Cudoniella acicularis TaxID=354080 RepID=A0A8H4RR08_9HELO|nr:hypothetical protein G7Y89_g3611 [Cudoniella acicularis]